LAFLDSEQEQIAPEAPEPPRRREGGPERRRQQYLVRRLIAVGVGVALLILVVLGFRGCLEARSDRGLRNYTQDVGATMAESEQYGKDFFDTLESPGGLSGTQLEQEVLTLRGASQRLVDRAGDIDAPDQMSEAHNAVVLSLRLRRDALQIIGENVGAALANAETGEPTEAIRAQMGSLFASDVLWVQEASPQIMGVLEDEGLDAPDLPAGNFMPETTPEEWLTTEKIAEVLTGFGGEDVTSGSHGFGLVSTTIGGTTLSPDTTTTVASDAREVEVEVQNQGDADESGVVVNITLDGETVTEEIPTLEAGESTTVRAALSSLPQPGTEVTLEVLIEPVLGEVDQSNNSSVYPVIFGSA
jgi:hypothetical protein